MRAGPCFALFAALAAGLGHAQVEPAPAAAPQLQLAIEIDPAIVEPVRSQMKAAIAAELAANVLDATSPGVGTLRIARGEGAQLQLSYSANPAPIERSVPWSADAQASIRDVALMAANLVRDQTLELLQPATAAPAAPTPSATPVASTPATPIAPVAPRAAAPLDAERPPDFVPRPPPMPAPPPPPPNQPRVQLLAIYAPLLAAAANIDGEIEQESPNALGLQGRFDLPIAPQWSLGAGFGVYEFAGPDGAEETDGIVEIEARLAMDVSAWLRAHAPLSGRLSQLYLALGAGPSLQSLLVRDDQNANATAPPALGLNASLLAGASLLVASHFGLALEVGAQYHLMRSRQNDGSWLVFHPLAGAVQFGVLWVFDG